jgi:hypothetical protein
VADQANVRIRKVTAGGSTRIGPCHMLRACFLDFCFGALA